MMDVFTLSLGWHFDQHWSLMAEPSFYWRNNFYHDKWQRLHEDDHVENHILEPSLQVTYKF